MPLRGAALPLVLVATVAGCRRDAPPPDPEVGALAATLCRPCHLLPAPASLTPPEWEYALSYMAFFLGEEVGRGEAGLSYTSLHPSPAVRESLRRTLQFMELTDAVPEAPVVSDAR